MDLYGIPTLPRPPESQGGASFLRKVIPVCFAGHFVIFCDNFYYSLVSELWGFLFIGLFSVISEVSHSFIVGLMFFSYIIELSN